MSSRSGQYPLLTFAVSSHSRTSGIFTDFFQTKRPVYKHRPFHSQACLWHPAASGKSFSRSLQDPACSPCPRRPLSAPFDGLRRRRGAVRPGAPPQHRGPHAGQGAAQAPAPCRIAALDQPVVPVSSRHPGGPKARSLPYPRRRAYPSARTRQTRPATAMTQSSTLRKACCEMCLTTGKAMQVPRMTPGAPYMAQVSTVGV